jgi:hypothetical protein
VIFVICAVWHFWMHLGLPNYIFDDTFHVSVGYLATRSAPSLRWADALQMFHQQFANDSLREFRPLSFVQNQIILSVYARTFWIRPWLPTIVTSLGFGAMAAAHFAFGRRILGSSRWALLATLLFVTAIPVLSGSWIVAMGWQWVVSLSLLLGLLGYQNHKQDGRRRWIALIAIICVVGSWFREYSGFFVFFCLIHELLFVPRRSPALLLVLAACAFHVIFPAFLANVLLAGALHKIALTPVFKLGPIAALAVNGPSYFQPGTLRWDAFYHFLLQVPPLLWCLAIAGLAGATRARAPVFVLGAAVTRALDGLAAALRLRRITGLLCVAAAGVTAVALSRPDYQPAFLVAAVAMFALVALLALPDSPLLVIYATASVTPFLKFYLHEVHLAYAVAPLAIVLVLPLAAWWKRIARQPAGTWRTIRRTAVGAVVAVVCLDAACNAIGDVSAMRAIYRGIAARAGWLRDHAAPNSIVVGNSLDLRDMVLYAPEHFQPYFSVPAAWEPNHVETGAKFLTMLDTRQASTDVYVLGAVFERGPNKYGYHHLHYLAAVQATSPERVAFTTDAVYPYADPLKYFVPDSLTSYPGPPDLVDDYWVGREQHGRMFERELRTDYLLLKVGPLTEEQRRQLLAGPRPVGRLLESYRAFNFLSVPEGRVVINPGTGLPGIDAGVLVLDQLAGPVNVMNYRHDATYLRCAARGLCFLATSTSCARELVDRVSAGQPATGACRVGSR